MQSHQLGEAQPVRRDEGEDFSRKRPEAGLREPDGDRTIRMKSIKADDVRRVPSVHRAVIADHHQLFRPRGAAKVREQPSCFVRTRGDESQLTRGRLITHPLHELRAESATEIIENVESHGIMRSRRQWCVPSSRPEAAARLCALYAASKKRFSR